MPHRHTFLSIFLGVLAIILAASLWIRVEASTIPSSWQEAPTPSPQSSPSVQPTSTPTTVSPPGNLSISDDYCLSCHGQPGQTMTLGNGEVVDLYVPADLHQNSIHGRLGYACVQCHTTVGEYPHPPFTAADRRDMTEQLNPVCARCHTQQFDLEKHDVHASLRAAGIREAAHCVDCHTAHEIRELHDPETGQLLPDVKTWIPERCALCHNAIYQKYKDSVHGTALRDGNPDVPTCIDCHGVHGISDPRTSSFRLRSPQVCARCHTDPQLMAKYGLSTDVLNTYVADFHGTTVAIFGLQSPDAEVNKPVCFDCHGVHDISRTDDPSSGLQMQANLLARCQICHPDASSNFPTAWMSHYIPSPENYPLVYYVNLFYKYFIPLTLGGMALLVVMDAGRMLVNRSRKRRKSGEALVSREVTEPVVASVAQESVPDPDQIPAPIPDTIEVKESAFSSIAQEHELSLEQEMHEVQLEGQEEAIEPEQTPGEAGANISPSENPEHHEEDMHG